MLQKVGDYEFIDGVLNMDAIGDAVVIKREISNGRGRGDGTENESGGRGAGESMGRGGGVEVVHDIARGVSKVVLVDFKGHMIG